MTITQIACYFNQIICYLHAGMNWCSKTYSFHLKLYNLKLYFCQQKNVSNCDIISQINFEFSWMSKHLVEESAIISIHVDPCNIWFNINERSIWCSSASIEAPSCGLVLEFRIYLITATIWKFIAINSQSFPCASSSDMQNTSIKWTHSIWTAELKIDLNECWQHFMRKVTN